MSDFVFPLEIIIDVLEQQACHYFLKYLYHICLPNNVFFPCTLVASKTFFIFTFLWNSLPLFKKSMIIMMTLRI